MTWLFGPNRPQLSQYPSTVEQQHPLPCLDTSGKDSLIRTLATHIPEAPWHITPADNKSNARSVAERLPCFQ